MAKLFEEVLNSASCSSSADILIHFSCQCDKEATPTVPTAPHASSPGSGAGARPRPTSPRATIALPRSASSPTRLPPTDSAAHAAPACIRCHSLVLRTQPSLLETLLPGWPGRHAAGRHELDTEGSEQVEEPSVESLRLPEEGPEHLQMPDPERPYEVTIDDEPEVFLEMIKFVYLNACHVDHSNVKAMMHVADKYGIEDIVTHCLLWMQEHFTASLFYHFLSFRLSSQRFSQLLRQSLLQALRSRRHFSLVTEGTDGQWEQLQVCFMEAMLCSDELPVISEAEVLHLLARWAKGALARRDRPSAGTTPAQESPMSTSGPAQPTTRRARSSSASEDELAVGARRRSQSQGESSDLDGSCSAEYGAGDSGAVIAANAGEGPSAADDQTRGDMLRLLRSFRKSDMFVKISDIEPILQIMNLNSLFSAKAPRETAALDPGFMIYRGVPGVNVPTTFSELNHNVVPHAWRGGSVSLGSHDFLQQQDGFRPSSVPDGGLIVFPRLWVRITCSSWSHREKRTSKSTTGLSRHSIAGPISGGDTIGPGPGWDTVPSPLLSAMQPVSEAGPNDKLPPTLKTMQSQDDWEIGRKLARSGSAVPNLSDNEKIDHKVVCAVISGHMRHGIRIGQHERSSIYAIEELYGQCEEVCVGGSPTEVEFELQLTVQAPDHCGICHCALAVLPSDGAPGAPLDRPPEPLLEVSFDASAEEHLHFYISSGHFDSNSSYSIALNWVLRPGMTSR